MLRHLVGELRRALDSFEIHPAARPRPRCRHADSQRSFTRQLDEAALADLRVLLVPRIALPDERIVRRGERGDAMFFIASGAVEVQREAR